MTEGTLKTFPESSRGRTQDRNDPVDLTVAILLLLLTAPLCLVIALCIRLFDGSPVFYKGPRLGRHKKPFNMYKFRTLHPGANRSLGARVLSDHDSKVSALSTGLGRFLRQTRLDELPQLFNVARGDMSFLGPRPERPEVYENTSRFISGSELRYSVKPGLIGYAQLFTPHGSPQKLRILVTNRSLRRKRSQLVRAGIILYAAWRVCALAGTRLLLLVSRTWQRVRFGQSGVRTFSRHRPDGVTVRYPSKGTRMSGEGEIADIDRQVFRITSADPLPLRKGEPVRFKLRREWRSRGGRRRRKVFVCSGSVTEERTEPNRFDYIVSYKTPSPMNQYLCEQYFLEESIAPPPS